MFKKVFSIILVALLTISVLLPTLTSNAAEVDGAIVLAPLSSDGTVTVCLKTSDNINNVRGMQFVLDLPEGFQIQSTESLLDEIWEIYYVSDSNRFLVYNLNAKAVEQTETAKDGLYELFKINCEVTEPYTSGEILTATVKIEDISTGQHVSNVGSATTETTFVYVDSAFSTEDFTYTVNEDEATITRYIGDSTEVEIPEIVGAYSVVSVSDGAFSLTPSIQKVTIPANVTNIGGDAFSGCNALTIYGYTETYAETYANENNIPFVSLVNYFTVKFIDATNTVIKEIQVEEGTFIDIDVVNAISVKNIYGYTVLRDDEGNVVWNNPFDEKVHSDLTYFAKYKALDISSLVTLYKTDSDEYYVHEHYKYDTAIDLVYDGANSWVDEEGTVIIGAPTGRIYASGDRMKLYAKSDVQEAPEVAIVGKAHEYAKGFSVFAHVNLQNADAYGIIFASDFFHSEKANFDITDVTPEGAQTIRVQKIEVSSTNIGKVDFMTTLNYKAGKPEPTRWARAYVVVDGKYYYSQVVCNK